MPSHVLLVEDSPGYVRLTEEAFREVDASIQLHVVSDGVEAMEFLRREGRHALAPRPDITLLDLNMPKMDGCEVLALIKQDERLRMIPAIILTTSESDADIMKSYHLHANCYLSRPLEFDDLRTLVKSLVDFWLTKAKLPQNNARLLQAAAYKRMSESERNLVRREGRT
jgi:CheY-like chemotaxis protein